MNFVALDFETANLSRTSACALGVAVVQNGVITEQKYWLIKPTPFVFQFSWLHGITEEDTVNAPTFDMIWHEIYDMISHQTIVAHNASFDMGVINASLKYYDLPIPTMPYVCSVQVARRTWKNLPHYNLKALSDKFSIPLQHHNAMSDTLACAKIMLKAHETLNVQSVTELCKSIDLKAKVLKAI